MKIKWLICALAIAAAACSDESVERAGVDSGIAFSTLLSRGSAVADPAGLAAAGGFNVWAYGHPGAWSATAKTPLLENVAVASADNGATWSYSNPVNWPGSGVVTFFACAPAGSAAVSPNPAFGVPEVTFSVDADPLKQKDFLIAEPLYDCSGGSYAYGGDPVRLSFDHVLSQVHFSALLDGTFTEEVIVTRIELRNIYSTGRTSLVSPVVWQTDAASIANYTLQTGGKGLVPVVLENAARPLSAPGGNLFLMPQTLDRTSDRPEMTIAFTVNGNPLSYTIPITSPVELKPGRSYDYQISIARDAVKMVVIESTISLTAATTTATTQSLILSADAAKDLNNYYSCLSLYNSLTGTALVSGGNYFGIYGTYDLKHDIVIDLATVDLSRFTYDPRQTLIFDFWKSLNTWGKDENGQPWSVEVKNYEADWELRPSFQTAADATTGATIAGSNVIRNKGSIVLRRKIPTP